jgi:hypothetical protein
MITEPNMGLKIWNNLTDPYDHAQLADNWAKVAVHDHSGNKGVQIPTAGIADGAITTPKLSASLTTTPTDGSVTTAKLAAGAVTADTLADAVRLGLTDSSSTRRGKSIIATSETRTNTVYGTMPTADQVSNIVLPTDGLIVIGYQALWANSVVSTARAGLFIGANQLVIGGGNGTAPLAISTEAGGGGDTSFDTLSSFGGGLTCSAGSSDMTEATTGQVVGASGTNSGVAYVFAAAGTYTISVQFKSSSGTVTVKNRHLWVWTIGF